MRTVAVIEAASSRSLTTSSKLDHQQSRQPQLTKQEFWSLLWYVPATIGASQPARHASLTAISRKSSNYSHRQKLSPTLICRHRSAAFVLSTPASLSIALPINSNEFLLATGGPPGSNNNNFDRSGGGGGGGYFDVEPFNEAFQLAEDKPIILTLASFAVTRKAYGKITRNFIKEYQEKTGRVVKFRLTFAGSGTQARAIIDGLPADIAALALPLDIIKISEAGLIDPDWKERFPNNSNVCESVVSIVTRAGNPKNIQGWDDLARDDVTVIVANPKTAGVARWIFLALWGHKANAGKAAATKYVTKVFDRVYVMPRDAREASDVFYTQKQGDALLTYENEAIFTNLVVSPTAPLPYICPPNNVRIVCPVAVIDKNVDIQPPEVREAATAFVQHCFKPESQREFGACGFRSANADVTKDLMLPQVKNVWDVEKRLGDWVKVQKEFFDEGGILNGIMNDVSQRKLAERLAQR